MLESLFNTCFEVFFCEYCEIFKNNFFIEHLPWLFLYLWTAAFERNFKTNFPTARNQKYIAHFFVICDTFTSNKGWHWKKKKNKQKVNSILKLNFYHLKTIPFLHNCSYDKVSRYSEKIIGNILKNV